MSILKSLQKLEKIPRDAIVILVLLSLLIPIILPPKLPVVVSQDIKDFYAKVMSLPKGAVILHFWDHTAPYWAQCGAASLSVFNLALTRPVRNIFVSLYATAPPIYSMLMKAATIPEGKKYGVDWVYLGFIAGDEAAAAQLAVNLRVSRRDYFGTALENLPIMEGVRDYKDVALLVSHVGLPDMGKWYVRQWNVPYGTIIAQIQTPVNTLMNLPFRAANQIRYLFWANKGGAELETLLGQPGWGVANTDAQNFGHLLGVIMIILGNIGYWAGRKGGRS